MPLPLLSRPTADTVRARSPSPFATPATKPQVPTIRLTAATPSEANASRHITSVAPWTDDHAPAAIAPKTSARGEPSRKRLVPKKSKLGLLGSSSTRERDQDFSDVVRRVGGGSVNNGSSGFEIYVDPANDPDIGEILMVKKKKSRVALDGMNWGTLGEVTNVPSITKPKEKGGKKDKENLLKVKVDDNQKWWSIGRGRKDSKEKEKERAKSPEPVENLTESRARFNSLDSGILLSSPIYAEHPKSPVEHLRVPTPTSATLAPPGAGALGSGKDSVAIRAMRSVRSLARIGSWAQLKNTPNPDEVDAPAKDKDPEAKKRKKKKEKEKEKDKAKETIRYSGSSFEAGALTASPAASRTDSKSLGRKKASILGLGLPSTMRLPSSRSGSTASSIVTANTVSNRLSVDSANILGGGILARGRSGSTMSTASSLRPLSTSSCISGASSSSSVAASVRWDEPALETVKENRRKEKESRREAKDKDKKSKKSKSGKESSRKTSDSRKRTPLAAIFPGTLSEREEEEMVPNPAPPIVTIEEATVDGHGVEEDETSSMETPVKRARPRPMSEQLLGRSRPKAMYEEDDDNAVISLLDAATNDLAQLINRLDLEATPGTPDMTPMSRRSPFSLERSNNMSPSKNRLTMESPVKGLRASAASVTSLRPYAMSCSRTTGMQLGQNIAPWSTLNAGISPSKPEPSTIRVRSQDAPTPRPTHKRTMSPAPAADPSPVFKALRPATSRVPSAGKTVGAHSSITPFALAVRNVDRSPSSLTFGSAHSKSDSQGSLSASPVFKKARGHSRKQSSLVPIELLQPVAHSSKGLDSPSLPIPPEARRSLGLAGTMGGSIGSTAEQEYDASDPDSDIPDELQVILSSSDQEFDDTMSFDPKALLPSPGLPPLMPLPLPGGPSPKASVANVPVFRATIIDEDDHHADVEEAGMSSEDDTKKSFDFTGELQKLNQSGGSDRRSFVEQLENAFRTPAKIDLRYNFGDFLSGDVPAVPKLPSLQAELSNAGECSFNLPVDYDSHELSPMGFPIDVNAEPSLLPGTDSFATTASDDDLLDLVAPQVLRNVGSMGSRPSDGELNRDFKFGGRPSPVVADKDVEPDTPLTLTDIIPPPSIAKSLSTGSLDGDESALLKSIFAKAVEIPSPPTRVRLDSDSSSKRRARGVVRSSIIGGHQRNSSALSFAGFDSFAEVRRGFEFNDSRPGFYPPPGATSDARHGRHESVFSIASVSSYGHVLNNGSADPFDYGAMDPLPSLRERPSSDDFSFAMSTSVDDTFSFIHRQPRRRRVDSDASSFYFRGSVHSQIHPYNRSHRRHESTASVGSLGPPISLYNRSFAHHRRGDSSASMSSVAQSYAMCGANGGRAAWARHRPDFSVDSVLSDYSGVHLGRPGLGDKMLDSALDRGMPLTAISASPPESLAGSVRSERIHSEEYGNGTTYDSLIDSRYQLHRTAPEDSIFEKTGYRTSVSSSDSMFFNQNLAGGDANPPHYRPISSLSIASVHSPIKEDDTMISMLGGGHVRRCSVGSMIETSPCVRVERRKNIVMDPPETLFNRFKNARPDDYESPEKSRVIEAKPSIASTLDSFKFGDERMIRAKHGLLERQSLENTVLMAEGEDLSGSFRMPVFTRPTRANRSRSSTCTSSSGAETPPLSISDGYSSFSDGSQSSIDLSQVNLMLSNATHPLSNAAFDRVRPRARGHGHRRRISQARASRTSIYETIEEELTSSLSPFSSPAHSVPDSATKTLKLTDSATKTMRPSQVFVVDPETSSVDSLSMWDDEKGITTLRKYYALKDEAQDTVIESKRVWLDTPFSLFAVQSFDPPRHPSGMQALLEHSLQNYGPLPSELRPRRMRSRVNSRPSPYPRTIKTSFTSSPAAEQLRVAVATSIAAAADNSAPRQRVLSNALQQVTINPNVASSPHLADKPIDVKAFALSPGKPERVFGLPPRPRVGSTARRVALGWAKRSTGRNGFENKENNTSMGNVSLGAGLGNASQGIVMTPSETLRLNRPRPRGRPTPASAKPIRA
ncbi:hypothetical protein HYDPIDRAFT_32553 [Hydnomerulius pinastri MD-312]|uniref:Uncharacterized protein n=1 Tax=Hydnomerulius pinastri MD-312 TaxID=994086 RepID=A0A0C9W9V6_9AGAM|nr:hypothetical protein HYDPIDRAFT_32553 [Hydnomerulius pinastri MD-312]